MKLETQLAKLAPLGLVLNPGIEIDDLLHSIDRSKLEAKPYKLLVSLLGSEVEQEPWGRQICDRVWNFDTECINETGDYIKIVKNLCRLTGDPEYLTEIADEINWEDGDSWLEYNVLDRRQKWTLELNDDWADMMTLTYVMDDLQRDGNQFYSIDNEQSMILFYCTPQTANKIGDLCKEDLEPIIPS
jgi:hypothetical protein